MTAADPVAVASRATARALLLGDRIDAAGLERADMLSANPLAFRAGAGGMVVLYRFGVAVTVGLSPLEEDEVIAQVRARLSGPHAHVDDETATLVVTGETDDRIPPGGAMELRDLPLQPLPFPIVGGRNRSLIHAAAAPPILRRPSRMRDRLRWRPSSPPTLISATPTSCGCAAPPSPPSPPTTRR